MGNNAVKVSSVEIYSDCWDAEEPTVVETFSLPIRAAGEVVFPVSRASQWDGMSDAEIRRACRSLETTAELPAISL